MLGQWFKLSEFYEEVRDTDYLVFLKFWYNDFIYIIIITFPIMFIAMFAQGNEIVSIHSCSMNPSNDIQLFNWN